MRRLLRLILRIFPEDRDGILRTEMEETFLDGYRDSGSSVRFAVRECLSLLSAGVGERLARQGSAGGRGYPGPTGPFALFSALGADLRLALRRLRKAPGFSAATALTLAVGIGATVAMFSILDAALLRALPYPEPDELVLGSATFDGELNMTCSFPDYMDHRDASDAFEVMAAMLPGLQRYTVTGGDRPERAGVHWVTHDFFDALQIAPTLGRAFAPADGERGAADVAVISHGFWQRWFGGEADVLGRTVTVNGYVTTVVGVMPAGFRFRNDTDLWAPVRPGSMDTDARRSHSWQAVGRLRDGVSLEEAQAQLDVISAQIAQEYPESHEGKGMGFVPLSESLAENYRPSLLVLMGATALLLLIACGNVAGLLAARATTRRIELSVRAALGAGRGTLARQLFVESLLLATLAGVGGTLLALWLQRIVLSAFPLDLLGVQEVGLSGPMLAAALVVSLATALLFGVAPALTASQANPAEELRGSGRTTGGGKGGKARGGLVMAQVALSVVLLTGSGLLIQSFVRLRAVEMGFQTENVITGRLALPQSEYPDSESRGQFFQGMAQDVESMPGVLSASYIDMLPIRDRYRNWYVWDMNNPPEGEERSVSTYSRTVMPGYFETLGIPLLRGRDHEVGDGARTEPYLVISESAAEAIFPEQDPVGRLVTVFNGSENNDYEVLGVVGDIRANFVSADPSPVMYFGPGAWVPGGMSLVVRSQGDPYALVASIRQAVLARDPDVPLVNVTTLTEIISESISEALVLSIATALFAITALLLSLTGLYAVLAFHVARRTQEIGIRVAFGATSAQVLKMVMKKGLILVGGGLVLGLGGAWASTRLLQNQLYQVGTTDPFTFVAVAVGFLAVGMFACLVPGRRATRVDPVRAMQVE